MVAQMWFTKCHAQPHPVHNLAWEAQTQSVHRDEVLVRQAFFLMVRCCSGWWLCSCQTHPSECWIHKFVWYLTDKNFKKSGIFDVQTRSGRACFSPLAVCDHAYLLASWASLLLLLLFLIIIILTQGRCNLSGAKNLCWVLLRVSRKPGFVLRNISERALKSYDMIRWIRMERHWKKKLTSHYSPCMVERYWPTSRMKSTLAALIGPSVSKAKGKKMWRWKLWVFFSF